jgi:hypothetical protein
MHGRRGFLLSCEELATLWHPPVASVQTATLATVESRELPPPVVLPTPKADVALLGTTVFRGQARRFGMLRDDRRRHLAILGKTGMGKSTLLHTLLAADIAAGHGVALLDPHGDLAEVVLGSIPRKRTNEVVVFDPSDRRYPIAWNPLACRAPEDRPLVASAVVSAFKKLYADSWGPRLEHILRNSLLALVELPDATLLSVLRLLSDADYRRSVVPRIQDPVVRSFWINEFAHWKPQYRTEAIAPIQNKVGQFLSHPILRGILAQGRSSLNLRAVLDKGGILIANLSKGRIGEDGSALLGALLLTSLQLAAMGRAEGPEEARRDFYCYVDEFQNFAAESFAAVLSEARKYRLNLILAHQYLSQLDDELRDALFGNVGTLVAFELGACDAELVAQELGGDVLPEDLVRLPRFTAYVRLLMDGVPSRAFSMRTLPSRSRAGDHFRISAVRAVSRRRYSARQDQVEAQINRWFATHGEVRAGRDAGHGSVNSQSQQVARKLRRGCDSRAVSAAGR